MKSKLKELEVDSIGAQRKPLTKEEQAAISAFLQELKEQRRSKTVKLSLEKSKKQFA